jgi:hypothetical protein
MWPASNARGPWPPTILNVTGIVSSAPAPELNPSPKLRHRDRMAWLTQLDAPTEAVQESLVLQDRWLFGDFVCPSSLGRSASVTSALQSGTSTFRYHARTSIERQIYRFGLGKTWLRLARSRICKIGSRRCTWRTRQLGFSGGLWTK